MAGDFIELRGAEGFLKLSKALKQAGQGELRKKLHKEMRDVVNARKPKAERRLAADLPSGMRGRAKVRQVVRVKTGADPGVSVTVPYGSRNKSGLGASNARMMNDFGMFRHPVLADTREPRDTWRWVSQFAHESDWFDDTWHAAGPEVRQGLEKAVQQVIDQIVREVG